MDRRPCRCRVSVQPKHLGLWQFDHALKGPTTRPGRHRPTSNSLVPGSNHDPTARSLVAHLQRIWTPRTSSSQPRSVASVGPVCRGNGHQPGDYRGSGEAGKRCPAPILFRPKSLKTQHNSYDLGSTADRARVGPLERFPAFPASPATSSPAPKSHRYGYSQAVGSRGGESNSVTPPPPCPYGQTWAVCIRGVSARGHRCDVEATTGDVLAALVGDAAGGTGCPARASPGFVRCPPGATVRLG